MDKLEPAGATEMPGTGLNDREAKILSDRQSEPRSGRSASIPAGCDGRAAACRPSLELYLAGL